MEEENSFYANDDVMLPVGADSRGGGPTKLKGVKVE